METTLIEGKAEIGLAGNPQSAILLHPNEKVIIPNDATVVASVPGGSPDSVKEAGLPVRFVRRAIVQLGGELCSLVPRDDEPESGDIALANVHAGRW